MFARLTVITASLLVFWSIAVRPSDGAGRERSYVVKRGDTLWSIAAAHYAGDPRGAVWRLERRNGLSSALLQPGQRLVLP